MNEVDALGEPAAEQGRNRFKALLIIVGAMLGLLLLGIAFAVAQFTIRTTENRDIVTDAPVREADLDVDRGRVEIAADREVGADLAARLEYFVRAPALATSTDSGEVAVGVDCDWPSDCELDVSGTLQQGADIRVRTSSGGAEVSGAPGAVRLQSTDGELSAQDARGDVNVGSVSGSVVVERARQAVRAESRSGRITVRDHAGPLRVRSSTGFVVGEGLSSPEAVVEVGSGRIDLEFVRAPERLEVDLSEGIVDITVPAGRYRIDVDQGLGDLVIEGIERDPDSDRRLALRVSQGNVTVRGT